MEQGAKIDLPLYTLIFLLKEKLDLSKINYIHPLFGV